MTVTGAGSEWTNNNTLNIGYGGKGFLTVSMKGLLTNTSALGTANIGYQTGSTGSATVDVALVAVDQQQPALCRLQPAPGLIAISNGGSVTGSAAYLGVGTKGTGTIMSVVPARH